MNGLLQALLTCQSYGTPELHIHLLLLKHDQEPRRRQLEELLRQRADASAVEDSSVERLQQQQQSLEDAERGRQVWGVQF